MTLLIAVHFGVGLLAPLLLRRLRGRAFFLLALAPLAAFVWTLAQGPAVLAGEVLTEGFRWIPALGVDVSFRVGLLQWVLVLVVSGIGALVLFYCRWYFGDEDPPTRTGAVLVAFAGAMTGLVTSDDLIGLYVFWELTTVFSYLLVGHNPTFAANRRAALTALVVTTTGGLAMLVGIVLLAVRYDSYSLSRVLEGAAASGVDSPLVVVAVLLVLVGALSKSALVPFHFWLPGAMAAPTPVSAYLHAAAMVKAGVYLVAVLAPVFGGTPGWRPVLLTLGAATMLLGGWRALRQYDVKVLLAYGTVSQLGFLVVLMGIGTRAAALGGLALLVSHALFKATLFLVVGIVDHSAGTRDLRKLAGVGRAMPVVAVAAAVAGASMAAVPPTLGFVAKEAGFESLTYLVAHGDGDGTGWPVLPAVLLTAALTAGSALTTAYTLRFWWGTFTSTAKQAYVDADGAEEDVRPHHPVPRGFAAAPVLLAALGLAGGFVGPRLTEAFGGYVAQFAVGEESHGLALWHGFSVPLLLSALALAGGVLLFWQRHLIARAQSTFPAVLEAEEAYQKTMRGVDRLAVEVTAVTQRGSLPIYLGAILLVVIALPGGALLVLRDWPAGVRAFDTPAQVLVGVIMVVAAFLAATSRGRLRAVLLASVTGYGVAVLFLLHGAPDLALTQTLVETVTLVVFALVLRKLPKYFTSRPLQASRWWRLVVAVTAGAVVSLIGLVAAGARVATPVSADFPEAASTFGYGDNIVNITLVDIRAWDTLGEIAVLVVAATGVASLIFLRSRYAALPTRPDAGPRPRAGTGGAGRTTWLRGGETLSPLRRSIIFEVVTRVLFPVMVVVSVYLLIAGHNAPGGGFAGGLVAGMALVIRYLAAGSRELDEAAPVDAGRVLGAGLVLAGLSALAPLPFGGRILQSYDIGVDFGRLAEVVTPLGPLPLLGSPHLVTSVFFDVGVYLVVIGVMLDLARSLGSGIDQHEAEDRAPVPQAGLHARAATSARPVPAAAGREIVR
ncbi:multisubunit sodium/proton antiporter, MrpA subunit /multisubunit sodium/proton antiporter, MrpB subunit [Friedmanniella luteola]|uniref:Multisubunit sodium/proton antiporter, MrpA subunit /multisubunit sodium/proton antiporter, MrpB subunit n=1 Tax=Friedmanniella luteola TaxID=546871 RepID=A0A1H1XUR9_9ACTN|nr:Na+/H+ antiporter subunit A [Friedmanniella luteola]SDT12629.1 multisubunit sodium/proton antiporter, MrpA subunit /multisubunit sodium/proton antiporter, MrpB subunit [Friedmanniella luteola]